MEFALEMRVKPAGGTCALLLDYSGRAHTHTRTHSHCMLLTDWLSLQTGKKYRSS